MAQKLTYEEWCEKYITPVTVESRQALKKYHNIDADAVFEQARRKEYDFYLNGGFDNV